MCIFVVIHYALVGFSCFFGALKLKKNSINNKECMVFYVLYLLPRQKSL
jgi:hypothetical protein